MGVEESGVRLVAEGEAQFTAAMKRAKDGVDGLNKSTQQGGEQSKKAESAWKKYNDTFKQITGISLTAAGAIMVGVGAVKAIASYMEDAIQAASAMNETVSKSQVVFGQSADEIEAWGNTAATAMGMSKQEALEAAGTYGNLFTSMGLARDVSADMSMELIQLASDLASFNNASPADTLEAIRAGLVGETEPLRRYGINISEAALKQEALNMGLKVTGPTLDAATKAQAAYSLMLKQSANAQGDFARTSDGAANQQRILEAKNKDLAASIGQGLLPAYVELLGVGNDFLTWLDGVINYNAKVIEQHEQMSDEVMKLAKTYEDYAFAIVLKDKAEKGEIRTIEDLRAEYEYWKWDIDATVRALGYAGKSTWEAMHANVAYADSFKKEAIQSDNVNKGITGVTSSLDDQSQKLKDTEQYWANYIYRNGIVIKSTQDLAKEQEILKGKLSDLQYLIRGDVGKAQTEFKDKQLDLISKINSLNIQIDVLEGKKYLTEDQKKTLSDLRGKLSDAQTDLQNLQKEFELSSKKMAFDMLVMKAASDGLTEDEVANLTTIATNWGLMDQATATAVQNLNKINLDQAWGELKGVDDLLRSIFGQPSTKNVNVNVVTTYTGGGVVTGNGFIPYQPIPKPPKPADVPGYTWYYDEGTYTWYKLPKSSKQAGGPVYAGTPYWVGENGPEPFIPNVDGWILSNSRAMAAMTAALRPVQAPVGAFGRSVSYYNTYGPVDNSKHYDLGVNTSQSPQLVQRSFAQMELLS